VQKKEASPCILDPLATEKTHKKRQRTLSAAFFCFLFDH